MSTVVPVRSVEVPLPFRLRTLLGALVLGGAVLAVIPRARAAWRLHAAATKVANYGLCMAGPVGAVAIREDAPRFRALARRRLVGAEASDRPFARCGTLAKDLSGRSELDWSHSRAASDFIEWGGGSQAGSINELFGTVPDLESLHRQSWPLVRKPLSELVRPSRGAYEAVHPMDLAQPRPVQGIVLEGAVLRSTLATPKALYLVASNDRDVWALRSRDHGISWTATSAWQTALEGHAHHCLADSMGTRFTLASARAATSPALLVGNLTGPGSERREFGTPDDVVQRVACDESGAVVLTQRRAEHRQRVFTCPLTCSCREVALPSLAQVKDVKLDVARVAHTLVVALAKDGLVRVVTSRDEGATLTPLSLVFDLRASTVTGLDQHLSPTLLSFGRQLELVLATKGSSSVWGLVSDDYGASFHAP